VVGRRVFNRNTLVFAFALSVPLIPDRRSLAVAAHPRPASRASLDLIAPGPYFPLLVRAWSRR